jgi:hypothetical protein
MIIRFGQIVYNQFQGTSNSPPEFFDYDTQSFAKVLDKFLREIFMKQKRLYLLILMGLLLSAACGTSQTTQTEELSPTEVSSPTSSATDTSLPAPTNTPTSPPSISTVSRFLWVSSSADLFNRVVSVDPENQQRIAYCAPNEIRLSHDGGQTWGETVPTSGVSAIAEQTGYTLYAGGPPSMTTCVSVTLDPEYPSTFYAVFTAAQEQFGAPPVFYMGFYTTDNGSTWQLVPPPPSSNLEDFGGFWNLGDETVEAMFNSQDQDVNIALQETGDGGGTWLPGELSCPQSGPCLRWGAAASTIPGMGSPLPQTILSSSDGGNTWLTIAPPVELRTPAPNQLVAFSDHEIVIISGSIGLSSDEPEAQAVRYSQDSGLNWQKIELPPLSSDGSDTNYFPGLQILPDESYLTQDLESSTWLWMSPSYPIWCPVNTDRLPPVPQLLQSVGDRLWWVNTESNQAEHISLSEITCAES